MCNFCNVVEDYTHFFIRCNYLNQFWDKIKNLLIALNFEVNITLKHLVIGYKIHDREYFDFNYMLSILAFSIYKSYYVSEQKKKRINVFKLFICELNKHVRDYKFKHKSVLFNKVIKYIESM